jgi:RNA polymerase sigma-70 factor (ECF subfamily)
MADFSDNALMLQVKDGRVESLGLLFERYKVTLYNYFLRNTCNSDLSEDLVQNVFFRILKYCKNFAGTGQFKSWMYTIAHNVLIDETKKLPNSELKDSKISDDFTPEEAWQYTEQLNTLEKALNQLKMNEKEILVLSRFQGLKYKDIAEIFGISESAVKVRVFRALRALKEVYSCLE